MFSLTRSTVAAGFHLKFVQFVGVLRKRNHFRKLEEEVEEEGKTHIESVIQGEKGFKTLIKKIPQAWQAIKSLPKKGSGMEWAQPHLGSVFLS